MDAILVKVLISATCFSFAISNCTRICVDLNPIGVSAIIICFHMLREEALSYSDDMVAKDPEDVANMPT